MTLFLASVTDMTWPEAFAQVGCSLAVALGVWAFCRHFFGK